MTLVDEGRTVQVSEKDVLRAVPTLDEDKTETLFDVPILAVRVKAADFVGHVEIDQDRDAWALKSGQLEVGVVVVH